jgi:ZIP family zinc transporter
MWLIVAVASALASGLGYALLSSAPEWLATSVQLFAGGAILAMLSESMIPEAYEKGGRAVGLVTVLGFAVSATLSTVA